jgi:hypothetical protein
MGADKSSAFAGVFSPWNPPAASLCKIGIVPRSAEGGAPWPPIHEVFGACVAVPPVIPYCADIPAVLPPDAAIAVSPALGIPAETSAPVLRPAVAELLPSVVDVFGAEPVTALTEPADPPLDSIRCTVGGVVAPTDPRLLLNSVRCAVGGVADPIAQAGCVEAEARKAAPPANAANPEGLAPKVNDVPAPPKPRRCTLVDPLSLPDLKMEESGTAPGDA